MQPTNGRLYAPNPRAGTKCRRPTARSASGRADRWSVWRGAWFPGTATEGSRPTVGSTCQIHTPERNAADQRSARSTPGRADRWSAWRGVWFPGTGTEGSDQRSALRGRSTRRNEMPPTNGRPDPRPVEPTVGRLGAVCGFPVSERKAADQRSALRARSTRRNGMPPTNGRPDPRLVEPTVGRLGGVRGFPVPERNAADQRSALPAKSTRRNGRQPTNGRLYPPDPRAGTECSRPTVGSTAVAGVIGCSAAPAPRRCRLGRPAPNGRPVRRCAGAAGGRPGSSAPARRRRTAGPCRG